MRASATCCGGIPCVPKKCGTRGTRNWRRSRPKSPSRTNTSPTIRVLTPRVLCRSSWLGQKSSALQLIVAKHALTLTIKEDTPIEAAKLDGCYVLKTDLTPAQAPKELVHDRYKDLASVEQGFRSCKAIHLEVRPIFLRFEARTRAQAFIVMPPI